MDSNQPKSKVRKSGTKRIPKLKDNVTSIVPGNTDRTATNGPFVGKLIAFACNSPVGQNLISEFGKQWTPNGICYHLDPIKGHIVGTVMQRSRGIGSRTKDGLEKYDVVWEFNALVETSVLFSHLLEAHITAQKLLKVRENMKPSINVVIDTKKKEVLDDIALSDDEACMKVSI